MASMGRFLEVLEPRISLHAGHDHGGNESPKALSATDVSLAWAKKRSMPLARDEAAGAAVNNQLFVFGGFHGSDWTATRRVDRFDVATNTWRRVRDMPEPLTHVATVLRGHRVWMIGGLTGDSPGPSVKSVYIYDTKKDRYTRGPSLPEARGAGAAAIVNDTLIYFGGLDRKAGQLGVDKRTTWTLDLAREGATWTKRANMPNALNHIASASVGGNAYAIGGQAGTERDARFAMSVARYNPKINRWTTVASMPGATSHVLASTLTRGNSFYVIGGEASYNVGRSSIYRYDASADRWTTYATLPEARRAPVVGLFGDALYVTGGSYDPGRQTGDTIRAGLP